MKNLKLGRAEGLRHQRGQPHKISAGLTLDLHIEKGDGRGKILQREQQVQSPRGRNELAERCRRPLWLEHSGGGGEGQGRGQGLSVVCGLSPWGSASALAALPLPGLWVQGGLSFRLPPSGPGLRCPSGPVFSLPREAWTTVLRPAHRSTG